MTSHELTITLEVPVLQCGPMTNYITFFFLGGGVTLLLGGGVTLLFGRGINYLPVGGSRAALDGPGLFRWGGVHVFVGVRAIAVVWDLWLGLTGVCRVGRVCSM